MGRRTTIQLALLVMGLVIWGYGQRIHDSSLQLVGVALFALATMLRFFRRSGTKRDDQAGDDQSDTD